MRTRVRYLARGLNNPEKYLGGTVAARLKPCPFSQPGEPVGNGRPRDPSPVSHLTDTLSPRRGERNLYVIRGFRGFHPRL